MIHPTKMEAAQPNPRHSVVTVRPAGVPIVATGMEVRKMGMLGFVPPLRLSSNMYGSLRVGYGFVCEAVFLYVHMQSALPFKLMCCGCTV